jgi:hypothetical protein
MGQMAENPLLHFFDELIQPVFDQEPFLEKKPHCPDGFVWRDQPYRVVTMLAEWVDHQRRGRMARNMRESHANRALVHGSWGVGRYFFRVLTDHNRVFDIYYDRTPTSADDRKGHWFVLGERQP